MGLTLGCLLQPSCCWSWKQMQRALLLLVVWHALLCDARAHTVTLSAPLSAARPEIDEYAGKGECERVSNCATGPTCCHRCWPNGDPCVWDPNDLADGCTWVGRCCANGKSTSSTAAPAATPPTNASVTSASADAPAQPSASSPPPTNATDTTPQPSNATGEGEPGWKTAFSLVAPGG